MEVMESTIVLNTIEEAIEDIKAGKVIIVVDDEDRENEGDFICAAETITPEVINFMSKYGRGLICTPIEEERAKELNLDMMVRENTAMHETAFTVSIDLIGRGCTTGISAYDRSTGIKAITDPNVNADDFARPGHIFPLVSKKGGVLRRTGHTEATVDIAKIAGFYPAGVLVEILNEDGSMARLPQLINIAKRHNLKIISIKDLVAYRMRTERIVKREMVTTVDSKHGRFNAIVYKQITTGDIHLALTKGNNFHGEVVPVRVHSNSETGDILGLLFDDYDKKITSALEIINKEGKGIFLYMRHGEKVNSIIDKLKSMDENENNNPLPSEAQRDFGIGAQILRDLGVEKLKVISNTSKKRIGITGYGLEIVDYLPL
jgi:3,4-dihydroxy 2-butanone 4-phosphate synthase/GTP cyclohydrolase II